MDYTASAAVDCGFDGVVLVVSSEFAKDIEAHVESFWPSSLPVEFACQPPRPGTAQAVLASRELVTGPFGVANADDLYGKGALIELVSHFAPLGRRAPSRPDAHSHVLVAYKLVRTVLTSGTVTRGLIEVSDEGYLEAIIEHSVRLREDGRFDAVPLPGHGVPGQPGGIEPKERLLLTGEERVSMNLWGFHPRIFDALDEALECGDPVPHGRTELLLPDVVEKVISNGSDAVHVVDTDARCIGLTHREDLPVLQEELAVEPLAASRSRAARPR